MYKTISTDYLRHNLKDVVLKVLEGEDVILKYGKQKEILLTTKTAKKVKKASKKSLLVKKLKRRVKIGNLNKSNFQGNQDLYKNMYKDLN